MIPGEMVIEEVYGLQCTGITLNDRFAILTAEHLGRAARPRRRSSFSRNQNTRLFTWLPAQSTMRMIEPIRQPIQRRLGIPGLRRFGSDGNLPGLQRSNSFGSLNQFNNRIPWRQSNSNLSRGGSFGNLSQASWHGRSSAQGGRRMGPFRGRLRGRNRQVGKLRGQRRAQGGVVGMQGQRNGPRGAKGKGRGGAVRKQQLGFQNNRNQKAKVVPTKEELDAQLDEYMAKSQLALDKELDEYMLKGSLMEFE